MPNLQVSKTFVSPLLTNVFVGYSNPSYIHGRLFPTVQVDKETGIYFVRDKENLRAPADARRGEFSRANRVMNNLSQATYTLEEKSLETAISERVMNNYSDPFDPKKNATLLVADKLALDEEIDLQNTIIAAASGGNTLDTSSSWATTSTDILAQVRTGHAYITKNTGKKANVAVVPRVTRDAILKNLAFIASIQYVKQINDSALRDAMAAWLDVEEVLFADAIQNTSKEGQADSMDWVWSDNFTLAYVERNPQLESTSLGYKLQQRSAAYVDEWFEQDKKTTIVRASDFYDNKIVDTACMYFISNTI